MLQTIDKFVDVEIPLDEARRMVMMVTSGGQSLKELVGSGRLLEYRLLNLIANWTRLLNLMLRYAELAYPKVT